MDVAVVGMSCRFPEADNIDEFWSNLIAGRNSVRSVPKERWYMAGGTDLIAGFLKCPLDEFDSNFFNISPKEAPYIDPQQRLFYEVSWESLEDAGIPPTSLNGTKTGVYLGIGSGEYFRNFLSPDEDTMYKVTGNTFSAATGRLSFFLNLTGPSIPVEATCASSAVAIHLACVALRSGECTMALAGGVNVLLETTTTYPSALTSPSCRSFDASASGFAPAEGCGVIVLKLLKDAVRDGNQIHGIIRGTSLSHTGKSTSFGTPDSLSEEQVIRDGLKAANVDPLEVSYVEAHAGGTAVGDPIEVRAISKVFANPQREAPLVLGAFKTNIGHPLAAAGIAGVIKMLLCMKHRTIPKNLHFNEVHPDINLGVIPAVVPTQNTPWNSSSGPLVGAVNCFGITGTNVHMVLQEPPSQPPVPATTPPPPMKILTISAKDEVALESLRGKYQAVLDSSVSDGDFLNIDDFTYSANTRRSHLSHRVALIGSSTDELSKKLRTMDYVRGSVPSSHLPIVFLFTGHGCQYFGMAQGLYDTSPVFRDAFNECNTIYKNNLGISLREFIWEYEEHGHEINRTKYSQPAIFSIEYCLFKLWTSLGVKPDFVLGHSIGEFAAAVAAGIISFEDGMKLVCCRSILVDEQPEGRMIAIGASVEIVSQIIESFVAANPNAWLDIACMNSREQTVVSTENETAASFKQFISDKFPSVRSKILPSEHAFHSRCMDPILDDFERIANEVELNEGKCKYISGLLNREVKPNELNGNYWRDHCRNMVSFSKAAEILLEKGCKIFLEVSPQPTLLNFVMANNSTGSELITCPSIRSNQECWTTLLTSLAKIYVNTNADIRFENIYKGQALQLPSYAFNRKKCWAPPLSTKRGGQGPSGEKMFHSLLGWKLNLAMSNEIRFYNYFTDMSTGYVHDHVVGGVVIVPAACYIEMLLTLARKEFGCKFPVIEQFQVLRALPLDAKPRQVQTKAEYNGPNVSVGIFSENDGEWIQHLQATLNLESTPKNAPEPLLPLEFENIKSHCSVSTDVEVLYHRLDVSGISMGPLLKSMRSCRHSSDGSQMLAVSQTVRTKEGEFICHPIMLDSIVQGFWHHKMCQLETLPFALPVGIEKITWYGDDNCNLTEFLYFHIQDPNKGIFYSSDGKIVAEFNVLTVLTTTVAAFLKSLSLAETLPQFMTKDMVPYPTCKRVEMSEVGNMSEEDIQKELEFFSFFNDFVTLEEKCGKVTYLYILRALIQLGWNPVKGSTFKEVDLYRAEAPLVDKRAYGRFLKIMAEEGLIAKSEATNEWTLLKSLPALSEIEEMKNKLFEESAVKETIDYKYINHLGDSLPIILKGEVDPVDLLFSKPEVSLARVYSESQRCNFDRQLLMHAFESIFQKSATVTEGKKLRILEVGAGSGAATSAVIEILEKLNISFDYTFTDIGPSFLLHAKSKFSAHSSNMTFKLLDIEKDPKSQGFNPHAYDVVIAFQVLHATEDLKVTLENTRHLLVPDGYMFLTEIVDYYRDFAMSFDLLKSYWRLKDFRTYVTVDAPTWINLLGQAGYRDTVNLTKSGCGRGLFVSRATASNRVYRPTAPNLTAESPAWIIFGDDSDVLRKKLGEKLNQVGRHAFHVIPAPRFDKIGDSFSMNPKRTSDFQQLCHVLKNYQVEGILYLWGLTANQESLAKTPDLRKAEENIAGGFLNVLKMRISSGWNAKIVLVTCGAEELNPAQGTLWGMLETYYNEYSDHEAIAVDLDQSESTEISTTCIFNVLWDTPNERGLYFSNGLSTVSRAHSADSSIPLDEVSIPKIGKYKLTDPTTFEFSPLQNSESDGIEISVRAVGLNFRDLLLSNGLMETDHPDSVGLEFAGVVSKVGIPESGFQVGDRVAGLTCTGAIASHITLKNPELLLPIPSTMSFTGAATLPVAYGTCYLAMVEIANLQPGERVLVHTGSGGVGLAGIQLARVLGAEIFVTAGTDKKRKYLRECIGLTHVYNSRTLDYKDEILRDTQGKGIDVVVNTLTGPGFKEATLECMAPSARFIELSKLNIWTEEDVKNLRPDVKYEILDAFDMILNSHPSLSSSLTQLSKLFENKELDVLYHSHYPLAHIRSAFKYFFGHTHIGKVVVEIPETNDKVSAVTLYNPESSYIVTGGIGGLGFEVGKYLWEKGGNVILIGRSKASPEREEEIAEFGERMTYVQCDIGDYDKCKEILDSINPPLRGVFHCAGVFANGFIITQSNESYTKSFNSKVYGTWNLHQLTKHKHLDHFVMFSSIASVVGSTGLSNYSGANRYLDSLIHYRVNQCGLPGLTINWGPWAEVGKAADYVAGVFKSFYHFSPQTGLQSMERAMRLRLHDIIIADMDSVGIVEKAPKLRPFLSELTHSMSQGKSKKMKRGDGGGLNHPSNAFLENLALDVLAADAGSIEGKMEAFVEAVFRVQSDLSDSDEVDRSQPLALMGMDSLIGMEMRLRISKLLDVTLPTDAIQEHNSVSLLSAYLCNLLAPAQPESSEPQAPDTAEPVKIIETPPLPKKITQAVQIETFKKSESKRFPKFVTKRFQKLTNSDKKMVKGTS